MTTAHKTPPLIILTPLDLSRYCDRLRDSDRVLCALGRLWQFLDRANYSHMDSSDLDPVLVIPRPGLRVPVFFQPQQLWDYARASLCPDAFTALIAAVNLSVHHLRHS